MKADDLEERSCPQTPVIPMVPQSYLISTRGSPPTASTPITIGRSDHLESIRDSTMPRTRRTGTESAPIRLVMSAVLILHKPTAQLAEYETLSPRKRMVSSPGSPRPRKETIAPGTPRQTKLSFKPVAVTPAKPAVEPRAIKETAETQIIKDTVAIKVIKKEMVEQPIPKSPKMPEYAQIVYQSIETDTEHPARPPRALKDPLMPYGVLPELMQQEPVKIVQPLANVHISDPQVATPGVTPSAGYRQGDTELMQGPILITVHPHPDYSKVIPGGSPWMAEEEMRARAFHIDKIFRRKLQRLIPYCKEMKLIIDLTFRPAPDKPLEIRHYRNYFDFLPFNDSITNSGVHVYDHGFDMTCSCNHASGTGCTVDNLEESAVCACSGEVVSDTPLAKIPPYDVNGLLRAEWLDYSHAAIIQECNENCGCTADVCGNMMTQRPRSFWLRIFYTGDVRKWGVKTESAIKRGTFVETYIGEIITHREAVLADFRAAKKGSYLFALDHFKYHRDRVWDDRLLYAINSEFKGNCSAFINHSCEPNLRCFPVRDTQDERIYRLAFFAVRDIAEGEELTFDYAHSHANARAEDGAAGRKRGRKAKVGGQEERSAMKNIPCGCGSAKCRGFLWQ